MGHLATGKKEICAKVPTWSRIGPLPSPPCPFTIPPRVVGRGLTLALTLNLTLDLILVLSLVFGVGCIAGIGDITWVGSITGVTGVTGVGRVGRVGRVGGVALFIVILVNDTGIDRLTAFDTAAAVA